MKTKIFCDSADFKTIKQFNNSPLVQGFTTNPSLMRQAGAQKYKLYCLEILRITNKPVSFFKKSFRIKNYTDKMIL